MHRVLSRSLMIALFGATLGATLGGVALAQSQSADSLGDVARANRASKQAQESSGATPKVITNQDLPAGSTPVPQSNTSDTMSTVSGVEKSDRSADRQLSNRLQAQQRTSELWKARIQEQENRIADLQARIDRVNSSIHNAVGTAQYDTPASRYQAVQTERLAAMQDALDQQKRRLATMEDAARRAGMDQ
jgi:chromosome segregation ATPase